MPSGFQHPLAPGERPESARASGAIGSTMYEARGYPDRPAITALCQEALDGALALVRADGGELALLDATRPILVTRARRTRPPHLGRASYGAPSRPSQPIYGDSIPDDPLAQIDDQITQLLPSAQVARVFEYGQGLMGTVWKLREHLMLRPETASPETLRAYLLEPDAPYHLAVPIFHPERLDRIGGSGGRSPVIGALRVFNRDEMWSYTTHDARLLELHGDRLARALALLTAPAPELRQDDLVATLRELNGVGPTQEEIFTRVVEIITRAHPSLAVSLLLLAPQGDALIPAMALRRGRWQRPGSPGSPADSLPLTTAPSAVRRALRGEVAVDAAPQAGASAPFFARLGWERDTLTEAALAAPIGASPRTLGALLVMAPPGEPFTPELTSRLEAIALATAVYLENARLVQDARASVRLFDERNRQLSALNNAVLTLNASLDEATSLRKLADQAAMVATGGVAAVFVRDEERGLLVCRAVSPPDDVSHAPVDNLLGATIPFTWRDLARRLEAHQDIVVDLEDLEDREDREHGAHTPDDAARAHEGAGSESGEATRRLRAAGASSFLATAIAQQETQLGALVVFTPGQSAKFHPPERQLLVSLASQAAVAISNARLYKRLEDAYERQKELDRLKDDFILTVSHEFRTPLTTIDGYVTLISRHGEKLDPEKLETFATEIRQATTQLAGMISMLADASRMSDLGDQALRVATRPVALAGAARVAVSRQPPDEKPRIQTRIEDTLWVMADDERLPLVFSNLISNALKYSGSDKPCRVTARRARRADLAAAQRRRALEAGAAEEWALVSVEDEGPGIAPEDQARLFQKFVRLHQSLTTAVRGTGLGLWICRQYIEAMGGEIWVESRLGHGARFSFILPCVEAPATAQ